jgi:hypothetical protein
LEQLGDTAAIRALELAALDPSNRALQEHIWALQDEAVAAEAAKQAQIEAINASYEAQVEGYNRQREAAQEWVSDLNGILQSLQSGISSFGEPLQDVLNLTFARAQRELKSYVAGRGLPSAEALDATLQGLQTPQYYASAQEEGLANARIRAQLGVLESRAEKELSDAERQLEQLDRQIELLAEWRDTALEQAESQYSQALEQRKSLHAEALGHATAWQGEEIALLTRVAEGVNQIGTLESAPADALYVAQQSPAASQAEFTEALLAEVVELRAELRAWQVRSAADGKEIRDRLSRWDADGIEIKSEGSGAELLRTA